MQANDMITSSLNPRKDTDALAGNPRLVGAAAGAAGILQTTLLLPVNTVMTNMQIYGRPLIPTLSIIFEGGPLSGMRRLYGAWPPTMMMVGMRQALIFGGGSQLKARLPATWPEPARDALSMAGLSWGYH